MVLRFNFKSAAVWGGGEVQRKAFHDFSDFILT